MANLTTTTLADSIRIQYEMRLLSRAIPRLVYGRWPVQAKLNKAGSYQLRKYGSLPLISTPLSEGVTPAEQAAPSITPTTVTPVFYGAWIGSTDITEIEVFDDYLSEVASILGEQVGLSADTIIRNALTDGATADYSGGAASRGALTYPDHEISYVDLVNLAATMDASSALPIDGENFILIIHPHTYASLMTDETFVNMMVQENGHESIQRGYLGKVLRFTIYVTANAREYADEGAGGTTDVYSMVVLAKESYGTLGVAGMEADVVDNQADNGKPLTGQKIKPVNIIVKAVGSAGALDPLNQRGTMGWKMCLNVVMLNADWAINYEHVNSFSNS